MGDLWSRVDLLLAGLRACVTPFISMISSLPNAFGWRLRSLCAIWMSRYEMKSRAWLMSVAYGYAMLETAIRISKRFKDWSVTLSLKSVQDRARNGSHTIDFPGLI